MYAAAYFFRPFVTDEVNRRYFLPGLTVKIIGALALGFVYQFYYEGGDTYNYHTHGSRHVWEAFWDSPTAGLKLLFSDGKDHIGIYKYSSRIPFFGDPSSYAVIRIASVFDLITFSAYSATAVCFGAMSFTGGWMLFLTFYEGRRELAGLIALATLFVPSVFFLGIGSSERHDNAYLFGCSNLCHLENGDDRSDQDLSCPFACAVTLHHLHDQKIHPLIISPGGRANDFGSVSGKI